MYSNYQDQEELEDELYREEDSEGSEVNSEVEFHLYSQLHYASDPRLVNGEDIVLEDGDGEEENKHSVSADPEQSKPTLHSKGGPQQRRELKRDLLKTVNPQRGKADAKSLRSSWASLEEVIVIDSGTDIVCSEDDTEGVCTLKGQRWSLQTSTPAQQASEKRKRSPSQDSVVVLNSGSESDVSELDSDDSSEILENWMILGQGNDVEDHSISLNLEGQSNSNTDCDEAESGSWLVSSKDRAARIYNQDKNRGTRPLGRRDSNRYYQDKNVTCRNCDKTGHLSKTCPLPQKVSSCMLCGTPGHMGTWCPNRHCNNCGLPGHLYEACSEKPYWFKKCHRCGMTGHFFDTCPEIWRQYHITTRAGPPQPASGAQPASGVQPGRTPAYCYNCSRKGHFGHACTQRRMYNGTYPSTPFINYYDTHGDFKQREHRIKWKVKELQEAGLLSAASKPPGTPEPPKKKLKINDRHNNNNNNNYHQSHQHQQHQSHQQQQQTGAHTPTPKPRRPAVVFKTKMSDKLKPHPVAGGASKQWKTKRALPATRAGLQATAPAPPPKHVFFEDEDFPRGGGRDEMVAGKRNRKRKKNNNNKSESSDPRASPFKRESYTPEQLFGHSGAWGKEKGRKAWKKKKKSAKGSADSYPRDENLFAIKQRKRKK